MFKFMPLRNRSGQGMVEYILIVIIVVTIVFIAYKAMGGAVKKQFEEAKTNIEQAAD